MPNFTLKFCLANIWRLGTAVVSIHMEDHINTMITRESAQTSAEKVRKKSYFFMTSFLVVHLGQCGTTLICVGQVLEDCERVGV